MQKLLFGIFLLAIVAGVVFSDLGPTGKGDAVTGKSMLESSNNAIEGFYAEIYSELTGARGFSAETFMTGEYTFDPPGPIPKLLKDNVSVYASFVGKPMIHIRSNSKGLRDEEFSLKPPENTTRILVLGDSVTYGAGVNASVRYTEVLERWLNSRTERDYQVINAGIRGYGAKNYYLFLKHKGLKYNPDLVVVSLVNNDAMSYSQFREINREADRKIRNYTNISGRRRINLRRKYVKDLVQSRYRVSNMSDPEGLSYLQDIADIAQANNINLIFYEAAKLNPTKKRVAREYARENNVSFIEGSEEYHDDFQSDFCLKYSPYRVSEIDAHPNRKGHRLIAKPLFHHISGQGKSWMPWPQGFFSWLDPC